MNISVSMETLYSHNHIVDDIERGVKIYERHKRASVKSNSDGDGDGRNSKNRIIEFTEQDKGEFLAKVPHKGNDIKVASLEFSRDGQDLSYYFCNCLRRYKSPPLCRHIVAAVLAIQDRVVKSGLAIGKIAKSSVMVNENNIASTVESGSLPVFSTPSMIALMEKAACACLEDVLKSGQTSIGTEIEAKHTNPSPIGITITASAKIEAVFGRKIEFIVEAYDEKGKQIGSGKHTRIIVDGEKFMERLQN